MAAFIATGRSSGIATCNSERDCSLLIIIFFSQIMLWMMFGCKYVNQTLEALGSDHADQRGIIQLLNDLQQMECLLPD